MTLLIPKVVLEDYSCQKLGNLKPLINQNESKLKIRIFVEVEVLEQHCIFYKTMNSSTFFILMHLKPLLIVHCKILPVLKLL